MIGQTRRKYDEIDIGRGIGILLVVLGHALKQTGRTNTLFDVLLSVIYSFHMPLFFVLSGFVAVKVLDMSSRIERVDYIRGRAARLLVPYFVIGILYMPVKLFLSSYAVTPYDVSSLWKILLGENPNVSLWYLYILFWCSVFGCLFLNRKTLRAALAVTFVLSLLSYLLGVSCRFPKYLFFFVLGIRIRRDYDTFVNVILKSTVTSAAFLAFCMGNLLLYFTGLQAFTIVTALSGTVCIFGIALWLSAKHGRVSAAFRFLGKYSMDIYILSEPINTAVKLVFWVFLKWNYLICTGICFLAGVLLPIPLSKWIVRRFKPLRVLILGMK